MDANDVIEKALVGRWIAGDSIDDAIVRARRLNAHGLVAIINYLGEEFTDKKDVDDAVGMYLELIGQVKENNVRADVSVKLTQLGLWINKRMAERNYSEIISFARKHGVFVWIDMETSKDVATTIDIYRKHARKGGVGITIQSSLRRSAKDVRDIVSFDGVIRLVKGAYSEPADIGFKDRKAVTRNYRTLMGYLFKHGRKFTIATHDLDLVHDAVRLNTKYERDVEYAMLNGIRNDKALELAQEGRNVYIYVPFGGRWVGYSYRRLREAHNVGLVLSSLLERQKV